MSSSTFSGHVNVTGYYLYLLCFFYWGFYWYWLRDLYWRRSFTLCFKQMYILGISAFFHDSAACLLKDEGIVAAAQEERFTRKKNDESFPSHAVKYCLQAGGIGLNQVDYIVYYEKPFLKFERLIETYLAFAPKGFMAFMKSMPVWLKEKLFLKKKLLEELKKTDDTCDVKKVKLLFSSHHMSHAASAFYPFLLTMQ